MNRKTYGAKAHYSIPITSDIAPPFNQFTWSRLKMFPCLFFQARPLERGSCIDNQSWDEPTDRQLDADQQAWRTGNFQFSSSALLAPHLLTTTTTLETEKKFFEDDTPMVPVSKQVKKKQ